MNKEEYLKDLIEIKYGNVKFFSEHAGLKYTTVRSILERGVLNAKVENVIKICDALGIKPEDILKVEDSIINDTNKKMIQLNPDRQQNVYNYADNQLKEQNSKVVNLPLVGKSAANPAELTYGDVEIEHDDFTDVPHGADTAIRIQGDSMEPLIQEEVENGEIAIVEIDGDGVTCKQIYYDYTSDEVILRSINKKYEPRHVKDDQVRIIGKVIL